MVRISLVRTALIGALQYMSFRAIEDAPSIAAAPVAPPVDTPAVAPSDAAAATAEAQAATSDEAPATVSIDVPAEHVSLLNRAAALLSRGESWIKDNIEAGISHFENIVADAKKDL
jgi:hypothetical protein